MPNTKAAMHHLKETVEKLLSNIGQIEIGSQNHFPLGWGRAAKGRSVWRLIEECITQNLELSENLEKFTLAPSELSVYDFAFTYRESKVYVNIKSKSKSNGNKNDDISKITKLIDFFEKENDCIFLILTINIDFIDQPFSVGLNNIDLVPLTWVPQYNINMSNKNLQTKFYRDTDDLVERTTREFYESIVSSYNDKLQILTNSH